MAVYKVPQDVEAEDKLLGPFSFRQFIYLIVAAIAGFVMWALAQIFIGLIVIPLPILAFFLILALPLRKDQPMETYLLAMVQFFLKPRIRYWNPDGTIDMVEITAPKVMEQQLTKDFTGSEASQRFEYLAQVIDTGGWAARGAMSANDSVSDILIAEAQQAEDVLDDNSSLNQSFDKLIVSNDTSRKQAMIAQLQQSIHQSQTAPTPPAPQTDTSSTTTSDNDSTAATVHFDPYPSSMHQRVITPAGQQKTTEPKTAPKQEEPDKTQAASATSPTQPSPDIIRLANNNDLSISAIAREAHRVADHQDGDEVVISLR